MTAGRGRVSRFVLVSTLLAVAAGTLLDAGFRTRKDGIAFDRLPRWVQEAAVREVPETDAAIAWLHEESIVEPLAEGGVRITTRRAGKLLDVSARDRLVTYGFVYMSADRDPSIRAWTVLPDGTAKKTLDELSIGDIVNVPVTSGGVVFEDSHMLSATAPGAVAGAVVAHEYTFVQDLDFGAAWHLFGSVSSPTAYSSITLRVPEGWGYDAVLERGGDLVKTDHDNGITLTATGRDRIPYEERVPASYEVLPLAWVRWWSPDGSRGFQDWDAVGRWYGELTAEILADKGEAAAIGKRMAPSEPSAMLDAIAAAFDFTARTVRYVAIEIGIGGWKPTAPSEVCTNRYGDCKDKTFLFRSLVDEWGVHSYAVMVRTKGLGPTPAAAPTPAAFNHVIAAVALPEGVGEDLWPTLNVEGVGRLLFLDGTVRNGDAWSLRPDVQGTTALLALPGGARLIELPAQPPEGERIHRRLEASVDARGALQEAVLVETYTGVAASDARYRLTGMSDEDLQREIIADLQERMPGASLVEYTLEGVEEYGRPVVMTCKLRGGNLGKKVSGLLILEPGKCARGVIGGSLPPPPRKWDLKFRSPRMEEVELRIRVPDGFNPEELHASMEVDTPELSVASDWSMEEGAVVYRRTMKLLRDTIVPERYEAFRKDVMKVNREANQGVVFLNF